MNGWVIASFVAGFIPAAILLVWYGLKTDWWRSFTGRVLFAFVLTTAVSYGLTLGVLGWPDFWTGELGELLRVILRFMVAAVLWGLLAVFAGAQRRGRRIARERAEEDDPV